MARTYWPRRLLPEREIVDRWAEIAATRGEDPDAYVRRWTELWRRIIVACRDQGTWDERDVGVVAELVECRRLAHEHQREADDTPFRTHPESGRIFAHPGLRLAAERRAEARELAAELLLTPESRRAAGLVEEWEDDGDVPQGDQAAAGL